MNNVDQQYLNLCKDILENGHQKGDRTGTGTLSVFGRQMRFNLADGFPILTTKFVPFRLIVRELLWFISGSSDVRKLTDDNVHIWTPDAVRWFNERDNNNLTEQEFLEALYDENWSNELRTEMADLGRLYGTQFRMWADWSGEEIDQLANVINSIKEDPNSRRLIIDLWHVGDIHFNRTALPACHNKYQFYVADNKLSCMMECRSNDVFLGQPFNIASGALLTHMIAQVTNLEVGELVYTIGDAHIYNNHIEQVKLQLTRTPRQLPALKINKDVTCIDDFKMNDFELVGYDPHPAIKGEVSVG